MARKYNLSRRLTWALALEAAADDIDASQGNSDIPFFVASKAGGTDDDASRIQGFQEEIARELRQRAAKIRARLA
jgi:hypothetical protein